MPAPTLPGGPCTLSSSRAHPSYPPRLPQPQIISLAQFLEGAPPGKAVGQVAAP